MDFIHFISLCEVKHPENILQQLLSIVGYTAVLWEEVP